MNYRTLLPATLATLSMATMTLRGGAQPPAPAAAVQAPVAVDPAVRALLATQPTTPVELLRALRVLVELGHPAAGQPLARRLAEQKLSDAALAELVDEFGSALLVRLARVPELNPDVGRFCDAALEAARRLARDPKRIAQLVERLKSRQELERAAVVVGLRSTGDDGAAALVAVLADPAREPEHWSARSALVELGSPSVGPLLAALTAQDAALETQAFETIGHMEDPALADFCYARALSPAAPPEVRTAARRAMARLIGRAPTATEAAARLHERLEKLLAQAAPEMDAPPPAAERVWRWDATQRRLSATEASASDARLVLALQLAADAEQILPASERLRRLRLTALAQAAARGDTFEKLLGSRGAAPKPALLSAGVDALDDLLSFALETDRSDAARVAAGLLGEAGSADLLHARTPQPCNLVRATSHPDRRVRFAAAEAIFKLAPSEPYPGSSHVAEAVRYFVRSSGAPRALVAVSEANEAARVAGLLLASGYEADLATDFRTAVTSIASASDYELIVVDMQLAAPRGGELLQRWRQDVRTARLPVAIMALSDEVDRAQRLARRIAGTGAIVRPMDPPGMKFQIDRLLAATGQSAVPGPQREQQAAAALAWLALAAEQKQPIYDLRRCDAAVAAALDAPALAEAAAAALGRLNTPLAQRSLANLASRGSAPIDARRAAAASFRDSISRHGTLLTSGEILRQYERYNQSETEDAESQKILAGILDAIEARAEADHLVLDRGQPTTEEPSP